MNIEIAANNIEKELGSLNIATIQMIDNAILKRSTCVYEQGQLKGILYTRKCQQAKTYQQYLTRNN